MRAIKGYPRREKFTPRSEGWWFVVDGEGDVPIVVGIEESAPSDATPRGREVDNAH